MNCAIIGLDWQKLTWREYQAALHGWNERHPTDEKPEPDYDGLRRFMAVH